MDNRKRITTSTGSTRLFKVVAGWVNKENIDENYKEQQEKEDRKRDKLIEQLKQKDIQRLTDLQKEVAKLHLIVVANEKKLKAQQKQKGVPEGDMKRLIQNVCEGKKRRGILRGQITRLRKKYEVELEGKEKPEIKADSSK